MRRIVIALAAVLAAILLAAGLSGCDAECSGHGGVSYGPSAGWFYCHDGTREYG